MRDETLYKCWADLELGIDFGSWFYMKTSNSRRRRIRMNRWFHSEKPLFSVTIQKTCVKGVLFSKSPGIK